MEALEALIFRTFILALDAIQEPPSNMQKTFSEISLEAETHLLDSWTMTMTSSLEILEDTVAHQSKNLKRQTSMTRLPASEEVLAEASGVSKALEVLEALGALRTMTSLVQVVEASQAEALRSRLQQLSRMEKR